MCRLIGLTAIDSVRLYDPAPDPPHLELGGCCQVDVEVVVGLVSIDSTSCQGKTTRVVERKKKKAKAQSGSNYVEMRNQTTSTSSIATGAGSFVSQSGFATGAPDPLPFLTNCILHLNATSLNSTCQRLADLSSRSHRFIHQPGFDC